ncbi:MAG: hypothetical protein K6E50_09185 [Lachnospiraceae bacterium]|nr:hypothetical protein [Lachnospiraceae bacterium]
MGEFLKNMRNGLAFSYSWLVLCCVIVSLINGSGTISVLFLVKLFVLCLWGAAAFTLCFLNGRVQKKGFLFCLSLFYLLFIPAEIGMFYLMGLFTSAGSRLQWILLGAIVIVCYLGCLLIDALIMKRRAVLYTEKMKEYLSTKE